MKLDDRTYDRLDSLRENHVSSLQCPDGFDTGALGPEVDLYLTDHDGAACQTVEVEDLGMTFRLEGSDWVSYPTSAGGGCEFDRFTGVYLEEWEDATQERIGEIQCSLDSLPKGFRSFGLVWWPRPGYRQFASAPKVF